MKDTRTTFRSAVLALVALLAAVGFSSCSDHVETGLTYGRATVGGILLSDNRIVSRDGFDASSMTAVGVVTAVRSDSIWAVSTEELGAYNWLDTLMSVGNVSGDQYALCGMENTAALLLAAKPSPAARAVLDFDSRSSVKGWFLPSVGELRLLSSVLPEVERSLSAVGGDGFSQVQYLSSSEDASSSDAGTLYAYCITLGSGYVSSVLKLDKALVRPMIRLKM